MQLVPAAEGAGRGSGRPVPGPDRVVGFRAGNAAPSGDGCFLQLDRPIPAHAIDSFMGADGTSRDWPVELKKSGVGATGTITGSDGTGNPMETVWTIDGTAAAAAGQWSGTLCDNGDDGVPKGGTGTFHSEYSTSGRMVGAFGVNVQ